MASLGSASIATLATLLSGSTYDPFDGSAMGSATLLDLSGSGSTPVDPKRYLNVGGTAVPIQ